MMRLIRCLSFVFLGLLISLPVHAQPKLKAWQLVDLYLQKGTKVRKYMTYSNNKQVELKPNELEVKNCRIWKVEHGNYTTVIKCLYSDHAKMVDKSWYVYESDLAGYRILEEAIYSDYKYDEWEPKDYDGAWRGEIFTKKLIANIESSKKHTRGELKDLARRFKRLLGEIELLKANK